MSGLHQKIFHSFFFNRQVNKFKELAQAFVDEKLHLYINAQVEQRLFLAQASGHYTAIFSSSPDFLVEIISKKLNVDCWKASIYQTIDGRFCNLGEILTGEKKATYLKSLMGSIVPNFETSEAFTDSYEDLPLLELVDKQFIVNPDKKLQIISKERDWEVI